MILNSPYISGSLTVTGNITSQGGITISGSITSASYATTSSFATTASYANTSTSASYALTASFATNATNFTASNILASNTITAQTLVVQTVTSSVVYSSGSNIFGNQLTNVQQMTGSLRVTGSITSTGAATFSSSVTVSGADASTAWQKFFTGGTYMGYIGSEGGWNSNVYTDFVIGATSGRQLTFYTNGVTSSRMVIASNGNVSIGGFDPTDTLGAGRVLDIGSSSGGSVILRDTTNPTTQYGAISYNGDSDNGLRIWSTGFIGFNLSGTRLVTITNSGSVGIGTNDPTTSLTIRPINGSTNALSILDPVGTAQRIAQISFGNATNDGEITLDSNCTNNVRISSNRFSYFNGGKVLIGTSSALSVRADANLQVFNSTTLRSTNYYENLPVLVLFSAVDTAGGLFVEFTSSNGTRIGSITRDGGSSVAYNTTSDERLKKNINNSLSSINKINSIQVRSFDWISDDKHQDFGFIAQELIEVAPEAVTETVEEVAAETPVTEEAAPEQEA